MSPQQVGEWASAQLAETQKRCEDQSPTQRKEVWWEAFVGGRKIENSLR